MKNTIYVAILLLLTGCTDFLDDKADKNLAIPESLKDVRAILDYEAQINEGYPRLLDLSADDYFLDYSQWQEQEDMAQRIHIWDASAETYDLRSWNYSYATIMICNVALESLEQLKTASNTAEVNKLRGEALFQRGFRHFLLAQAFAPYYDGKAIEGQLGVPYRTFSDVAVPSIRLPIADTYALIFKDLEESLHLLPEQTDGITRPNKATVYAALARIYLHQGNYEQALAMANEALARQDRLLDYNRLDPKAAVPFQPLDHPEIIYYMHGTSSYIAPNRSNVDTLLVKSFADYDLRKDLFFVKKQNGYHSFKGSYSGIDVHLFTGFATDELYLIRAEAYARADKTTLALNDLNKLLAMRLDKAVFEPLNIRDPALLLDVIIAERRKQLIFRGLRWGDLIRLNKDPRYQTTLTRRFQHKGETFEYNLPPNDLRYIHLIPLPVIERTGMTQNKR